MTPRHLNPQIDYCTVPSPPGTAAASLATPLGMAVTSDGRTLYVAAFGSSSPAAPGTSGIVGVFDTAALEAGTFTPSAASHIRLSGGGASGVVLNEALHRLYVLTRFDDAVSVVDTTASPGSEIQHLALFNPEPPSVVAGRPFLYDAVLTSSNGEAACASCHVFGDFDSLAWHLGDPSGVVVPNPNPFTVPDPSGNPTFHPLKGPMTTQTLRGMAGNGPMHWRGDRTVGANSIGNEAGDFEKFNVAFVGLLGLPGHCSVTQGLACHQDGECPAGETCVGLSDPEMQAFTDFILQVTMPPNPIRALDDSLTPDQQAGESFFFNVTSDIVETCNGCHVLDPFHGHFGTDGRSSFENETQDFKIPQLRNAYQKVGMFGMPAVTAFNAGNNGTPGPYTSQPHQVRGFGFLHDGSVDTLFRFHNAKVFNGGFGSNNTLRRQVEQFVLAFDSDLKPIVGQEVTLTSTNGAVVGPRIDLLIQQAAAGACDLTVKGVIRNAQTGVLEQRGAVLLASGLFQTDRVTDPQLTDAQVRALAATPGQELTYTCVPPGEGVRVGIDRDADGCPDRTELDDGTDPANPLSVPANCTGGATTTTTTTTTSTTSTTLAVTLVETQALTLHDPGTPDKRRLSFTSSTKTAPAANRIVPPPPGSAGDPTQHGAVVTVYNAAGLTTDDVVAALPAAGWTKLGGTSSFKGWRYTNKSVGGPVSSVVVKADKITLKAGKSGFAYTLDEPRQGSVAVDLFLGPFSWCAAAPAKASGNPPSTAAHDRPGLFVGQPKTPAPAACPSPP